MQKVVKDNIIYVDKPKMSPIPLVLSAASLFFIILGAAGLFYFQKPLQESQEIRQQASVEAGQVLFSSRVSSSQTYVAGTPTVIDLQFNSQGLQLSGIQIVTKVTANTETPLIDVPANSNYQAISQEVEQVSDGYLVSVIVAPKSVGTSFSSTSPTTFAQLTVPLQAAGQITLAYDRSNSFATVANTLPPRDELRNPENATFTIAAAAASPSPSPSPSPSATPVVTPTPAVTPTPVASATPNPTAIPTGDDFWLTNSGFSMKFYTDNSAQTEVALADLKPYQTYRIRVHYQVQNARKATTTNQTPVETAVVINGQGSSYATDTLAYSLIAGHNDGAGDTIQTKFTTQPNNTLALTVDSNRAYSETNEANNSLEYKFAATNDAVGGPTGLQRTCNQYCADSRECAAGFTCLNNRCRRPDNPDSTTCAAASVTVKSTITKSCNTACTANNQCANNLRCYQGVCRLATNLSSLSCSPATAGVISKGSGTPLGDNPTTTPQPSGSPTSSPLPSSPTTPAVLASPVATPGTTLDDRPEVTPNDSWFSRFMSSMQERGISIPVIAVVAGLILFVLALIFAILGRTGHRPPTVIGMRKEAPKSPYEDELQKKINSLKERPIQNPTANPVKPIITPPQPVLKPEVPVTQETTTTVTDTSVPVPPAQNSTMMSRLRERGVLDNMSKEENSDTPQS